MLSSLLILIETWLLTCSSDLRRTNIMFHADNVRDNFDSESEGEEIVDTKPTTAEPKKPSTTSSTGTKPKTKRPKKPRAEKPEEEEGGSILTYATPVLLLAATGLIVFSVYKYVWANKNK